MCQRAKANDLTHTRKERKDALVPLIQYDYGVAVEEGLKENFEFAVGTDMNTGSIWSTTSTVKGKGDTCAINSAASWPAELGHSRMQLQAWGGGRRSHS